MSKWNVYGAVTGTKFLGQVEAVSKEEAQEKADELDTHVSLCWHCADQVEGAEIQDIIVEEA